MIYRSNQRLHATQPHERQVGEALPRPALQDMPENDATSIPELDQLVERARWEMRHEPVRERGRGGLHC